MLQLVLGVRKAQVSQRAHVGRQGDWDGTFVWVVCYTRGAVDKWYCDGKIFAKGLDERPVVADVRLGHLIEPVEFTLLRGIHAYH